MTTLTCMRGFPGSGKDTIAREIADQTGAAIIGRDPLREMMFNSFTPGPEAEDIVTAVEDSMIRALLTTGRDTIVSDCNVNARYLKRFAKLATQCGADFEIRNVQTHVEMCVARDANRGATGGRLVGEQVIRKMAKRFPIANWPDVKAPAPLEVEPVTFDPSLPDAVIFDIDGTLTTGPNDRSPYDYTKVSGDLVDPDVAWMNSQIAGIATEWNDIQVIIMSGRDGSDQCRLDTIEWLRLNGIYYDELHMRPPELVDGHGNKVADTVVKLQLFNEHVRGKYNVRMVFDDRNQVVDVWRRLGLTCAQVQEGNF